MSISGIGSSYQMVPASQSSMTLTQESKEMIDEIVTADMKQAELLSSIGVSVMNKAMDVMENNSAALLKGLDIYI